MTTVHVSHYHLGVEESELLKDVMMSERSSQMEGNSSCPREGSGTVFISSINKSRPHHRPFRCSAPPYQPKPFYYNPIQPGPPPYALKSAKFMRRMNLVTDVSQLPPVASPLYGHLLNEYGGYYAESSPRHKKGASIWDQTDKPSPISIKYPPRDKTRFSPRSLNSTITQKYNTTIGTRRPQTEQCSRKYHGRQEWNPIKSLSTDLSKTSWNPQVAEEVISPRLATQYGKCTKEIDRSEFELWRSFNHPRVEKPKQAF